MMSKKGLRLHRGFTLIEMLVVIAILGILVAMVMPLISKALESGRRVACASNLRQLGSLLLLYSQSNDNKFPDLENPYWDIAALRTSSGISSGLPAYSSILKCPSDKLNRNGGDPRSYSMNPVLMNYFNQYSSWGAMSQANEGMHIWDVSAPSRTYLLLENHNELNAYAGGNWIVSTGVRDVHRGGMNLVFCDGHVEYIPVIPFLEFQEDYMANQR